ncbi:MAG TPA: ATP synthase F1 subunit epsilon [Cyclobacteriaceae bacterium]|nr:ATP synthase F1 subunit epsilon [Cyclobacteriaceae bacterium]
MKIEIITPDKKLFEGNVKSATFPGSEGSFGVLNNHASMIATLKAGEIELIEDSNNTLKFPVKGGVVEVLKNKVIVLAE